MYNNPVNTVFGRGSFELFLEEYKNERTATLFIVSPEGIAERKEELKSLMTEQDVMIDNVKSNPDLSYVSGLLNTACHKSFARIVGVGGGSVMDTAKIVKAVASKNPASAEELRHIVSAADYEPSDAKLFLLPTTAGTGSEKTKWATLWDEEENKKYSVEHQKLYADKVYIDPSFTDKTDAAATLVFALDAFCHATESFWSRKSSIMTREYSLSAMKLFMRNIGTIFDPADKDCRDNLALASLMAANAFSQTKTSICHAISYQLTLRYNIPHGLAAWMTLPYFLEFNKGSYKNEHEIYNAIGTETADELKYFVNRLLLKAELGYRLSDYGFKEDDLDALVKASFVPGRSDNNPVTVTEGTIRKAILSLK